jgi:hypothetical protein
MPIFPCIGPIISYIDTDYIIPIPISEISERINMGIGIYRLVGYWIIPIIGLAQPIWWEVIVHDMVIF